MESHRDQPQGGQEHEEKDAAGKKDAVDRGQEIIVIDDATRDQWRDELKPMIDSYLDSLKKEGVENPHELYENALALVQKYSNS